MPRQWQTVRFSGTFKCANVQNACVRVRATVNVNRVRNQPCVCGKRVVCGSACSSAWSGIGVAHPGGNQVVQRTNQVCACVCAWCVARACAQQRACVRAACGGARARAQCACVCNGARVGWGPHVWWCVGKVTQCPGNVNQNCTMNIRRRCGNPVCTQTQTKGRACS